MELEIWRSWGGLGFDQPQIWEYRLLAVYVLLSVISLALFRRDFIKLARRRHRHRLLLFLCLLAASPLAVHFLVLRLSSTALLGVPTLAADSSRLTVPLLGLLPLVAAATWLGAGPALVVGLLGGALRAGTATGSITDPFYLAFFGTAAAVLLRQDYRGRQSTIARQPLVVSAVVIPLSMVPLLFSIWARVADSGLSGLDYAVTLVKASLALTLTEGLVASLVVQATQLLFPRLRPVQAAHRCPPYRRSLSGRFLFWIVPLILIMTFVLISAVTATTVRIARSQMVHAMAQDAHGAAESIPQFIRTGQGLLEDFAGDEQFWQDDPSALEARLTGQLRIGAFFDQLALFDPDGQLLAAYPAPSADAPPLTTEEKMFLERVLRDGTTQISPAHRSSQNEALVSFLVPVDPQEEGDVRRRVLIGRTHLDINPTINRVLTSLQWTSGLGEGFLIDAEGRIVAHSDPGMLLTEWRMDDEHRCTADVPRGQVCESRGAAGLAHQLTYYLPAEGYPWTVVIRLPYEVVLQQARQIATPLLILQALFGGGLVLGIYSVTGRLTRPLKRLGRAADRIASGNLAQPVQVTGEDEVGRVGETFEAMRIRLKDRMSDLSLLLEISQAVAATLELPTGMPFILEGALQATGAQVAHAVFFSDNGEPQTVMSRGKRIEGMGALDRSLAEEVRDRRQPLIVNDLARAGMVSDPESDGPIKAVIALPVRTKNQTLAAIWVGCENARRFSDSKVNFLSTLAGQTAVLVENARLFQAVEGERRRLAALLDSIADPVVVTDRRSHVLLVNPAAEHAFDVKADALLGKRVDQTDLPLLLVHALTKPSTPEESLIEQSPLPDGRSLYLHVSTIWNADGEEIGRVALMRDVTRFRQLDQMKSEFLATVSHDLRAPLTFMRGYADRLDVVGELNDQQREYVANILRGIKRIDDLVMDLLDLRRIEAGLGLEREPCHLGLILAEAVRGMQARADEKDIHLQMEPLSGPAGDSLGGEEAPIVSGDMALLRQVFVNLLDNAIKYTPAGGRVSVGLSTRADDVMDCGVIHVSDTGIGIAPDDQVRLFEKFYRIRSFDYAQDKRRGRTEASGTGLGLAIVKSIVERHKGKVWVDSKLNQGSTFYVSLPLADDDPSGG